MTRNSPYALLLAVLLVVALPLKAQAPADSLRTVTESVTVVDTLTGAANADSIRPLLPRHMGEIRWYHVTAEVGAVALASLLDESLRTSIQSNRTEGKDDVARVFRHIGQPEVYGAIGLGTILTGVLTGNAKVRRAGERISAGLLGAGAFTVFLKMVVGRHRPNAADNAFLFNPFNTHDDSWPSGHTTMAFALATGVSDELHSTPATIILYGSAAMTGWSRINDDKHWLSDVLAGAIIGVTGAKFMNGHWKVLGLHGPRFVLEPEGVGVALGW